MRYWGNMSSLALFDRRNEAESTLRSIESSLRIELKPAIEDYMAKGAQHDSLELIYTGLSARFPGLRIEDVALTLKEMQQDGWVENFRDAWYKSYWRLLDQHNCNPDR